MERTVHAFFITDQTEFQREQVRAAEAAARRHGLRIAFRYSESNPLLQIHHVFESIHGKRGPAPDAILVESMTSDGMPRVARNAAAAGIGWCVINAAAGYLAELRGGHPGLPIFAAAVDNARAGEIQAAQVLKLLGGARGASVLCIQGPPQAAAARGRFAGLSETLAGRGVELSAVDGDWTETGGRAAAAEWLKLGRGAPDVVVGQNDEMAAGAREAILPQLPAGERKRVLFLGCDGLPGGGRAMVRSGVLSATVITPMPAAPAVDALAAFFARGEPPPEEIRTAPTSFPALEELKPS